MGALHIVSPDELHILRRLTYEEPRAIRGTREAKIIDVLVERGLLERKPDQRHLVRRTEKGEDAAKPLSLTRARMHVQAIRTAVEEGDPEKATSLERQLHLRALAETACLEIEDCLHPRALATIAALTQHIDFRRC